MMKIWLLVLFMSVMGVGKISGSTDGSKFPLVGHIRQKTLNETENELTIGCEVLDRDYTDYEQYKAYLSLLGMHKIRLQAGWAKTEKVKGIYDFSWLDKIVDDAVARGLQIWLEVSYGNPIYEGGGTPYLKGGWPSTTEGLHGWDNWVNALAKHYKGRVKEWEIWNEPDVNKERGKNAESIADLNIRTAEIIRSVDPDAKIAALALALIKDTELTENCMNEFKRRGKLNLFNWISFHQYMYRPEDMYPLAQKLKEVIGRYSDEILLWQGESGAPSRGGMGGALGGYDWNEDSQAKWALRRILSDRGHDIATGIFSISDMNYGVNDGIKKKNYKGILETDDNKRVLRPKQAFHSLRNLVAVYDILKNQLTADNVVVGNENSLSRYLYETEPDGLSTLVLWYDGSTPSNENVYTPTSISVSEGKFKNPVIVDILTGEVRKIPGKFMSKGKNRCVFKDILLYDSPIMITDMSLIEIEK